MPDGVALDVAAASMLQGMTAHYLVNGCRTTRAGDVALVHAAAGGVGLLLTQLLVAAGARVIGTCSSDAKEALARERRRASTSSATTARTSPSRLRRLTGGRGCDVVYDSVGQATFEGSLRSLRPRGLLVLYGQSSGPVPPFELGRLDALGSLFVTRPSLAHYTADRAELELRAGEVLGAVAAGRLVGAHRRALRAPRRGRGAPRARGALTTGKVLLLT